MTPCDTIKYSIYRVIIVANFYVKYDKLFLIPCLIIKTFYDTLKPHVLNIIKNSKYIIH